MTSLCECPSPIHADEILRVLCLRGRFLLRRLRREERGDRVVWRAVPYDIELDAAKVQAWLEYAERNGKVDRKAIEGVER